MSPSIDISLSDEIRSLALYLSLQFPSAEIRRSRPLEGEEYDIVIEEITSHSMNHRGTYMAETVMPLTIQRWCDDYAESLDYAENLRRLFIMGVDPGKRSRVPVWSWVAIPAADPSDPPIYSGIPDPATDAPARFLKVDDCEVRVLPAETPGQYVAICDVRLLGWRVTYPDFDAEIITNVSHIGSTDVN